MSEMRLIARRMGLAVIGALVVVGAAGTHVRAGAATQRASESETGANPDSQRAVFEQYCFRCHNPRVLAGGLILTTADLTRVGENAQIWEKVVRKLRTRAMPPPKLPRPDGGTYDSLATWLESELDAWATAHPNPGRTETAHRLNRTEYRNAVRDLLGVDVDVTLMLPRDDAMDGFDNVGDVLTVSPALLEGYLRAARKISRMAVGFPLSTAPTLTMYSTERMQQGRSSEDLPFGSSGGLAVPHYFPADGEYAIRVTLQRSFYDYIRGMGRPHPLDVAVDGVRVKRFSVGGSAPGRSAPASFTGNIAGDPKWEDYVLHADADLEVRVAVKAGTRNVGVSFVDRAVVRDDIFFPPLPRRGKRAAEDERFDGDPAVAAIGVSGPYSPVAPGDTPSRRKILICQPARESHETACAEKILSTLARRAYRRPLRADDVNELLRIYTMGHREGGFEAGLQFAIESILADPEFLFRIEREPANLPSGPNYRITDLELATRLSFFLWSSLPDDELLDLAAQGRLSDAGSLDAQVRRMLADPRSRNLVENFVFQWLGLRVLDDLTPDPALLPDYDEDLRDAFKRETQLFVESHIREDRSVLDLWRANYTFLNERLAKHYQIPNVYGINFRRVTLPASSNRGGLLGHGSVLMVTSYANRTSPVLRGKWVLTNVLGSPPPEPPPNVPALEEQSTSQPTSVRERLEQHRRNPVCAACHAQMDPFGLALEHFDAIGAWRATDGDATIDASVVAPSGESFDGSEGLRSFLLQRDTQVVASLTHKLLTFSIGRALSYQDVSTVRQIVRAAAARDYRWSALVHGIVQSPAFQMRRARALQTQSVEMTTDVQ